MSKQQSLLVGGLVRLRQTPLLQQVRKRVQYVRDSGVRNGQRVGPAVGVLQPPAGWHKQPLTQAVAGHVNDP